ncbi:MAG: TRAP transporter substrate-binding protein [Candidatus Competibacteraceae bacterium]|nr:TRAP transporter substrate-binding protein [Candidatus Competibacteraceae bacterium]MCB1808767.1 TRAP transporter substrate-binding protein [Candidatus Competibacteraceae bacterium]MCB1815809.1 TRAP transporter substrate-binding protein [Candidatus Competibacteraceae bacterium]
MRYFASLTASLLVIAGITSPVHAETVLKLGHVSSAENVYHKGALRFAERVAELTDGSVTVDALCCAQLGNDVAQAKTVQLGAQDLAIVSSNNLAQFYPAIDIFSLPALFEDIPSAQKAVFGPVGDEIFENFRKATGMRVVYTTAWGTRALINDKRSIKQPSDLDGILIRSPGSPVMNATYKAMGAAPTPVAFAELFTALQQKTVDGADMSPCDVLSLKYYEVQSHLTTSNLFTGFGMVVMNDRKFQSLSEAEQDTILQAGREAGEYSWGLTAACDEAGIAKSKEAGLEVVELTPEQRAPFFELARSVWPEFEERVGGRELLDRLVEASK